MSKNTRVAFVSLGCAKNTVDSEKMLGQLAEAGCEFTNDPTKADVVVVNTCGFLAAARDEAVGVLRDMVALKRKKNARLRRVVAAGCLVQRDGVLLSDEVPGVDALVGVNNRDDVIRAVTASVQPSRQLIQFLSDYHPFVNIDTGRLRITPQHWAYLRISEGCDQKCTFCTIPAIRGPMHGKPPSVIMDEARELVADGARELVLIAQDTTAYGRDFGYKPGLAGLLAQLNEIDEVRWIRVMYGYPTVMTDAIIDAIAQCEKVVKYVDMPLQHISDPILKAMRRGVTRSKTEELITRLRERIPGLTFRTTMISGFPGETDEQHAELLSFIQNFRFDALGVFPYSQEPDTPAGQMPDQIPQDVIEARVEELMLAQQEIAFAKGDAMVDQEIEVLLDQPTDDGLFEARHAGQAPEVDGVTWVKSTDEKAGSFIRVRCTGRMDYDLVAEPTTNKAKN